MEQPPDIQVVTETRVTGDLDIQTHDLHLAQDVIPTCGFVDSTHGNDNSERDNFVTERDMSQHCKYDAGGIHLRLARRQ